MSAREAADRTGTRKLSSEIAEWRADTPGCFDRIHLNNAGAALMPRPVLETMIAHLEREAEVGGYEAGDDAEERVAAAYRAVARLLGARDRNIAVVENSTAAFNLAVSAFDFHPGDLIVTTRNDYVSNQLVYLSLARRVGVEIRRAVELPQGGADPQSVRELAADRRCKLVAVSWVPTNSGLVQDVEAIGGVCAELDVPYLVDGCQAVGQLAVDVERLRCDFFCATARKFLRGPRGIGFLYVSDRMLQRGAYPLFVDMRGARWTESDGFVLANGATRFENWEFAYALVLGLGEAAEYSLRLGPEALTRTQALAQRCRERLRELTGAEVLDRGRTPCAIVSSHLPGVDAGRLIRALRERKVNASASFREYAVIDMDDKGVSTTLRLSPHYYNTEEEIDTAISILAELIS